MKPGCLVYTCNLCKKRTDCKTIYYGDNLPVHVIEFKTHCLVASTNGRVSFATWQREPRR